MRSEEVFEANLEGVTDFGLLGQHVPDSIIRTLSALYQVTKKGGRRWIVTYSGGKDSTTVCVIACEVIRRGLSWAADSVDIIYCDTLQEIPSLHRLALDFLDYASHLSRSANLPIQTHITRPRQDQTFWFLLLGKGYPAPHRQFWWCTERLKINPVKQKLVELNHQEDSVVLTGVRFGESPRRDIRMRQRHQCLGQGECGQALTYQNAVAPIAHWKTCQIWDFLTLWAPSWDWPTQKLADLYGNEPVRFGCWTCTLVDRDRALDAVVQDPEWVHLTALGKFREFLKQKTANPQARIRRPDGRLGKLTLKTRAELLDALRDLEQRTGLSLIAHEEVQRIREYWKTPEGGDTYANG